MNRGREWIGNKKKNARQRDLRPDGDDRRLSPKGENKLGAQAWCGHRVDGRARIGSAPAYLEIFVQCPAG